MKKSKLMVNVVRKGLIGTIVGIAAGLVFGLIIWGAVSLIEQTIVSTSYQSTPPVTFIAFLGMGAGAVIGSIFGAITGLKEK